MIYTYVIKAFASLSFIKKEITGRVEQWQGYCQNYLSCPVIMGFYYIKNLHAYNKNVIPDKDNKLNIQHVDDVAHYCSNFIQHKLLPAFLI